MSKPKVSTDVECPSCDRAIPRNLINFHLDTCLESSAHDGKAPKRFKASINDVLKSPSTEKKPKPMQSSPKTPTNSQPQAESSITREAAPSKSGSKNLQAPLAEVMRPACLEEYEGQPAVVGPDSLLRNLLETNVLPSLVLWGPPGCGKTTLAHIVANRCRSHDQGPRFVTLSATTSGVKDIKEAIDRAKNDRKMLQRRTILFIDEIHRFNKLQQDVFLSHVENGTVTLIGATTENPSFSLNSALLSRCQVVVLSKLATDNILSILRRALAQLEITELSDNQPPLAGPCVEREALQMLAEIADGDARFALNCLEMTLKSLASDNKVICREQVKNGLQRVHILYDRTGDHHYDTISAFIKSMRGSDPTAALYYLARMLAGGEDPRFIARRMIIFASEDVGLADSSALNLAVSTAYSCQNVGMPECRINLAHCATHLARAPKSRESYEAFLRAEQCVQDNKGPLPPVPLHLRNAPTRLMKDLGYGQGYQMYNNNGKQLSFLPDSLHGVDFFAPP